MNIPQDGRIIVIDDAEKEALPLLKALSKNGCAATYYTEKVEDMPLSPMSGSRLVFLDIVLGTDGQETKQKISTAVRVLEKILDKKNGPFILVTWTKHEELITPLSAALKSAGYQFLLVDLEKSECKKNDDYDVELISKKIKEKLVGRDALHLFIIWQNLVHHSAGKVVNDFSQFYPHDDGNWNQNMAAVFLQLARGYAGNQLDKTKTDDIIRNSLFSFNGAFEDALNAEIRKNVYAQELVLPFNTAKESLDEKTTGKINSKLMITKETGAVNIPGSTYENLDVSNTELSDVYNGDFGRYEKKTQLESEAKKIYLEVTPICDFAQKKQKVARLLPGIMWPHEFSDKIKGNAWYLYKSSLIMYGDKLYCLVFDFRYLTSVPLEKLEGKTPIFIIKQEFMTEIQAELSSHANRPGPVSVR